MVFEFEYALIKSFGFCQEEVLLVGSGFSPMGDGGQDIFALLLGLLLLYLLNALSQSLLFYFLIVLVEGRVLSLLEIHFFSELK